MTSNALLWVVALPLVGCAKTDSSDVLTSGIHASISATSAGVGTTDVHATLFLGNPINLSFVELTGNDELIASHGGEDKVMVETELLNVVSHRASFQTDAEGAELEVAFLRTVDDGAPRSIATLPAKFTLVQPATSASRAAALSLEWSPAATSDLMSWSVEGDCIERESSPITGDPGTAVIPADTIMLRAATSTPETCVITVAVTRTRGGTVDRGYGEGGTFTGNQTRKIQLMSTP
ncbi:MAG: hypothetical protein H0X17_03525 [Deltaproteobacteria bacterium]|nr:hypothetical protein [Deltaproteobacteria bacterium]